MDKLIYILFVLMFLYIVYRDFLTEPFEKNIEKFESSPTLEDINAVKSLAEVAKGLIAGGYTVPGILGAKGDINVDNPTAEGGRLRVINSLKKGAGQTIDWSIWNMTGGYGNKLAFWRYNGDGNNAGPSLELFDHGQVNATGLLSGNQIVSRSQVISNWSTGNWGMLWGDNCALIGKKGLPMRFGFADNTDAAGWDEKVRIDPDGTLNVPRIRIGGILLENNGNLRIAGSTTINGYLTVDTKDTWGSQITLTAGTGGELGYINFMNNQGKRVHYIGSNRLP